AGELGGCFVAPHPAISLPEGDWAGGLVEVSIAGGNAFDRLDFQPNPAFPAAEGVALGVLVNGKQTVTFNTLDIGEVGITGGQTMTCVLKEPANDAAIVALLGQLRYGNSELTPDWFTNDVREYSARTIAVTLTDALGQVTQVNREVVFPVLRGISLGDDLQLPKDQTAVLHLQGVFSTGQVLPVPKLATKWTNVCGSGVVGGVLNGAVAGFPGQHNVKGSTPPYCCTVYAKAGDLYAETLVYEGVSRVRTLDELDDLVLLLVAIRYNNDVGDALDDLAFCPLLHPLLTIYEVGECYSTPPPPPPENTVSRIRLHAVGNGQTSTVSPTPFYALEALMKETADGRRWAGLYREHGAEIVRIFIQHPSLMVQSHELIAAYQPGVVALLAGQGDTVTIYPPMIAQVNAFCIALAQHASPALKTALVQEQVRFDNFQRFQNASFSEWAGLLGLPIPTEPLLHVTLTRREATRFHLALSDLPGLDLALWRSPDLKTWARVPNAEIQRDGFTLLFTDPAPPDAAAYYEVRP
ncbi:MAG: hypothetical protein RIS76_3542, partial [Verrucomicrobiota bacterium]